MRHDGITDRRDSLERGSRDAGRRYLQETVTLPVRFSEVDAMRVVWHGHYVGYLEEARRAFGQRYGLDYAVFFAHHTPAPIVHLRVDYFAPARMIDRVAVTARLYESEAAKLEFDYEVRRVEDGLLLATATTVQVFTTPEGELVLTWPAFMVERLEAWAPLWALPPA